jgi:hypothetical protein
METPNKDPIELKPKEQGFDEAAEIVFDRTETATPGVDSIGLLETYLKIRKTK